MQERKVSRREFLKIAGIAGATLGVGAGLGGLVAACGGEEETTTTTAAAATTTTAAGETTTTAAGATTTSVAAATKTLKIGCIMPQSGSYGFYGISMKPSIERYAEIINEKGGYEIGSDRYTIELKFPDDAADPKRGPICIQELADWGAVANVGSFSQAGAMVQAATPLKMILYGKMVSGIDLPSSPYFIGGLCERGENCYNFRLGAKEFPESKVLAIATYDYQVAALSAGRDFCLDGQAGISADNPYATGKIKMREVDSWPSSGNQDWGGLLAQYKSDNVDLLDCTFGPQDHALMAKQAGEGGYKFNWISSGTMSDVREFTKIGGKENVQGLCCIWPVPWLYQEHTVSQELCDIAEEICKRETDRTGLAWNQQYMGGFQYGINHLRGMLELYKMAGTLDPDAIMETVIGATIEDFHGTVKFGGVRAWGDTARIKPSNIMHGQIVDDHFEYKGEIFFDQPEW